MTEIVAASYNRTFVRYTYIVAIAAISTKRAANGTRSASARSVSPFDKRLGEILRHATDVFYEKGAPKPLAADSLGIAVAS